MAKLDVNEQLVSKLTTILDFKTQKDLVDALATVTSNSNSTIYNKLSGRSNFTIEEVCLIAEKFDISLEELLMKRENTSYVPFHADGIKYNPRNYSDYIQNIIYHFGFVKRQPEVHGYFIANQIPLFHILDFPFLTYLKLFISNRTNWKIPGISKEFKFEEYKSDRELATNISYLKNLYRTFPNTEILNPHIIDNIISQFQYLWELEVISDKEHLYLFKKELGNLIEYLEDLTTTGLKPANIKGIQPQIQIYLSELNLGSELLLIKSSEESMMFHQVDVPNYMYTLDERMIEKQYQYFQTFQNISINITKSNEKDKSKFFKRLKQKLEVF
jgi:transcriptional regulator with XRE-family HTH domain